MDMVEAREKAITHNESGHNMTKGIGHNMTKGIGHNMTKG